MILNNMEIVWGECRQVSHTQKMHVGFRDGEEGCETRDKFCIKRKTKTKKKDERKKGAKKEKKGIFSTLMKIVWGECKQVSHKCGMNENKYHTHTENACWWFQRHWREVWNSRQISLEEKVLQKDKKWQCRKNVIPYFTFCICTTVDFTRPITFVVTIFRMMVMKTTTHYNSKNDDDVKNNS